LYNGKRCYLKINNQILEELMKKRILSVLMTFVMVMSVAVLPSSELVLTAEANTGGQPIINHGSDCVDCCAGMKLNTWFRHGLGANTHTNTYIIEVPLDGELIVEINVPRDVSGIPMAGSALEPGGANYTLRKIDETGTILQTIRNEDLIEQSRTRFINKLEAGTYHVIVKQQSGDTSEDTGQYWIIAELFADENTAISGSKETAQTLAPGMSVRGSIFDNDDIDFYRYELHEPGRLTMYMTGGNYTTARFPFADNLAAGRFGNNSGLNIQIIESSATGSSLFGTGTNASYGHTTSGSNRHITGLDLTGARINSPWVGGIDLEAGVYYIRVARNNSNGLYTLRTEFTPFEGLTSYLTDIGDGERPIIEGKSPIDPSNTELANNVVINLNNTLETAQFIDIENTYALTRTVKGFLSAQDGSDLYRIVVTDPGVVLAEVSRVDAASVGAAGNQNVDQSRWYNPGSGGIRDMPHIRWLNEDGNIISGTGTAATRGITVDNNGKYNIHVGLEPGIYYIEIARRGYLRGSASNIFTSLNCQTTGTYVLALDFVPANNDEEWHAGQTKIPANLLCCDPPEAPACHICLPYQCTWCPTRHADWATNPVNCSGRCMFCICGDVFNCFGKCTMCVCKDMDTISCNGIRPTEFGVPVTGLMSLINNTHFGVHPLYRTRTTFPHKDTFEFVVTEEGIISLNITSPVEGGLPDHAIDYLLHCFDLEGNPIMQRRFDGTNYVYWPLVYSTKHRDDGTIFAYNARTQDSEVDNVFHRQHAVEPGIYRVELVQRYTGATANARAPSISNNEFNNNNSGIYTIQADFTPVKVDEIEPNNSRPTATRLFDQIGGGSLTRAVGMLSLTDNSDFYRIVIDEPGRIQINISRHGISTGLNDVEVVWWQELGGTAEELRREALFPRNAASYSNHLDLEITWPGVYYIEIMKPLRNLGTTSNPNQNYDSSQAGVYELSMVFTATESDENTANTTRAGATEIQAGQTIRGLMSHQRSSAWYVYDLEQQGNISIHIDRGGVFPIAAGALNVRWFDEDGVQIPNGAVTSGNLPFNLNLPGNPTTAAINNSLVNLPAGRYYIEVSRRGTAMATGTYGIRVTDNNAVVRTVTNVTIHPEITCCPLQRGHSMRFTAEVTGGINPPSQAVNWRILETDRHPGTNINSDGVLTVHNLEPRSSLTVRATSAFDNTKQSETFTVPIAVVASHLITIPIPVNGSVRGGGWHAVNCNVTVTAIPNIDYAFDGWFEGTNKVSDDANFSFVVTAARTLEARFRHAPDMRNITATSQNAAQGTVTGGGSFEIGETATLTATPNQGFNFVGWFEGGQNISTSLTLTFTVEGHRTLQARFTAGARQQVRVTNGTGGGNFAGGATVTITANEIEGMQFNGWTSTPAMAFANHLSVTTTFVMPTPAVAVDVIAHYIPLVGTVESVTVNPATLEIRKSGDWNENAKQSHQHQFSATVQGTGNPPQTVTWQIKEATHSGTFISAGGLLTIHEDEESDTFTIVATSTENSDIFGEATFTFVDVAVTQTVTAITVTPNALMLNRGGTHTFSAAVTGTNAPQGVTWEVPSGNAGTFISNGVLTIAADETRSSITVTARSTHTNTVTGAVTVSIFQPTVSRELVEIQAPAPLTGIASGTTVEALTTVLQTQRSTVVMVTNDGNINAAVTWDVANSAYNPATTTAQNNIVVNGTVTLPAGIIQGNVELTTSISISVLAATAQGPFTVTFNLNGGSGTTPAPRVTTPTGGNHRITLPNNPTRSNHTFAGWFTVSAATGGTRVTATTNITENITVWARWTSGSGGNTSGGNTGTGSGDNQARTITFNLNGGNINGNTSNITRTTQASGLLASAQRPADPRRTGYTFDGWFTAATGGTQRNLATFEFTANTTLFARWERASNETYTPTNRPSDFAVPSSAINAINNIIPKHLLRITSTGNFTLTAGTAYTGQQAVLVRFTNNRLEFVSGTKVAANGNAVLNVTAAGDYVALIYRTGDVTGDGEVNTSDALEVLRGVAGVTQLSGIQNFVANGNTSTVGTGDALQILRFVAGLIREL
jgi:uncharacterized repeat protein (TIGR02543 family)